MSKSDECVLKTDGQGKNYERTVVNNGKRCVRVRSRFQQVPCRFLVLSLVQVLAEPGSSAARPAPQVCFMQKHVKLG